MKSLLVDEISAESTPPLTKLLNPGELTKDCAKPKCNRRPPDIVLGEQMSLFD